MTTPVLVVDDSALARRLVIKTFPKEWSIEITQAGDGVEAMAAYRAVKPEVIFLDLNMPQMDGYEVLQALRDAGERPCVIVLSGDIQPKAQERIFALGARAFLKKPCNTEDVRTALRECGISLS